MIVGDQVTDLLREVEVHANGNATVYFEPQHVQYLPVLQPQFDVMEIQVSTLDGRLAKLGTGVTNVTLHFRRGEVRERKKHPDRFFFAMPERRRKTRRRQRTTLKPGYRWKHYVGADGPFRRQVRETYHLKKYAPGKLERLHREFNRRVRQGRDPWT